MTDEQLVKDAIAFAVEHGDKCPISEGYADQPEWREISGPTSDWLSDWGAFMADHVFEELKKRGFSIFRTQALGVVGADVEADYVGPQSANGIVRRMKPRLITNN